MPNMLPSETPRVLLVLEDATIDRYALDMAVEAAEAKTAELDVLHVMSAQSLQSEDGDNVTALSGGIGTPQRQRERDLVRRFAPYEARLPQGYTLLTGTSSSFDEQLRSRVEGDYDLILHASATGVCSLAALNVNQHISAIAQASESNASGEQLRSTNLTVAA